MSLSAMSAKYHEIIVNTGDLPKEDMLKYLAEVQELYAKIDPNYKTYVRGK